MSSLPQHRAMHDAGPYAAAVHPGHNNLSHAIHQQAALTAHYARCPYEEKVITNGTTARMVLVFLRELLEQLPAGEQVQQSYGCPMTKCHRTFSAPLQVIQHLLSCPELLNGEFDCDKCNTWHSFPTNEKDWAQWTGWRSPTSPHPIQRKRSLGSKMKETFALRKKDASRKQNSVFDPHFKGTYPMDTRPSTAASETPSMAFASRAFEQRGVFPAQPEQRLDFSALQKPMSPNGLLDVSDSMFWSGLNASDLPSTVSSVAISSAADESPSEPFSQNTSQTTLFSSGLGPYQSPTSAARDSSKTLEARPFIFATQPPFGPALTSLPAHPPSVSAMSLDDPAPANQAPLSPAELGQTATNGGQAWWDPKVDVETTRATPPSSGPGQGPCFPLQTPIESILPGSVNSGLSSPTSPCEDGPPYYQMAPAAAPPISRALSHESMHTGITTVFGTPTPEGGARGALSPHGENNNNNSNSNNNNAQRSVTVPPKALPESSVEDLVCDECQWKPRGVKENLKGYLRKHKNTHKGVRLACDVPGCVKTFSRLDNLKKHKKDKHGIEDTGSAVAAKRATGDLAKRMEEGAETKRPATVESEIRGPTEDYSMLWPALHF